MLAVISVGVNLVARLIINRTGRVGAPVGRRLMTYDAGRRARHAAPARLVHRLAGPHLPGARPHHGAGGLAPPRRAGRAPGRTGSGASCGRPLTADRRRPARPDPRHPDPHARRLHHRRDHRRARRHPPGRAGPAQEDRQGELSGPLRTASDILSGFPSIVLGYVGLRRARGGPALGLLAPRRRHHPLHHGDPLHRQDDRELAAPGARRATARAPRPWACRWATACARWCSRARCPASSPASSSPWPSPAARRHRSSTRPGFANTLPHSLTHAQFPYLTYVVFQYYNAPETQYHYLAYDAALILVVIVLLLLVASRIIVARTQRHAEGAAHRGPRTPWRPRPAPATSHGRARRRPPDRLSPDSPGARLRGGRPPATYGEARTTPATRRRNVERRT